MSLPRLTDFFTELAPFAHLRSTLPAPGERRVLGGLHGSSDAVVIAALARDLPRRLFVVVAEGIADAERWRADIQALVDDVPVALYPPREGFGEAEPHVEVAGERVETLERLGRSGVRILLTTARAALERTRLPGAIRGARLDLKPGDVRRPEALATHLESIGFERVPMVEEVAQFSVRGGIMDIYGFGMADPVRLEFIGDEIAEMRHFELLTQRATRDAGVAVILPVDGAGGTVDDSPSARTTLAELWPPDALVVIPARSHLDAEMQRTWDDAEHHLELARRRGEDVASREALFEPPDAARARLAAFGTLALAEPAEPGGDVRFVTNPPESIDRDVRVLRRVVRDGIATIILCDNAGQCERLDELLNDRDLPPSPAALAIGVLDGGFVALPGGGDPARGLRVLTDHEIFRRERRLRRARRYSAGSALETITALRSGDYVVHLEHGVGIYRGIQTILVQESTIEVAVVEYEGGDRLNVPLYRIDQIERYRAAGEGDPDAPPPRLHRLGGKKWAQQREKTRAAIQQMTVELLDLYARRQLAVRPAHRPDTVWQRQLESSFLFEDTPDQRKATADVKRDMDGPRPMDRLLIGDVGYGKTEIAIRAAFKAVESGRQVAVLVPTTILAEQHARTFGDRLADFPVTIRTISRFLSTQEQASAIADVAAKKVDVVIGTHRLLSPDVTFPDLGLIVVDEEHRFGVKHKERLKQLKLETDVITLTATPIPRTLHLALAGLRDVTLMQTPPRDRSPVLTYVEPLDDGLIDEGISRELDRGGQVFFVHNRIETITAMADHIGRIIPRARMAVAHGQMRERDLEDVMRRFVRGDVDVLVSTMIVESGLNVPNANTMFVNRADRFGLAQLYQLRGRVGRSHRRAYCYLLVPDRIDLEAERRLKVLEHHTELGSGYQIALADLEMRGAGNLLGPEQSGFVHAVGFDLYLRLLGETVEHLKRGGQAPKFVPADVSVNVPAYLPDDYIASQEIKLDLYRRLSRLTKGNEIDALRAEVRDRFGPLPVPADAFFTVALLRVLGGELRIEGLMVRGRDARVNFRDDAAPRLRGVAAAFHDVQFQAEVRRTHPLSLKLIGAGGMGVLDGLVRALRAMI